MIGDRFLFLTATPRFAQTFTLSMYICVRACMRARVCVCSGTLTSGWGIPAGWPPENSLFDKQHMGFLYFYEEDDKRVVVPGLGG